jgi:nitrogen-specific signal transduction histidine kinase
MLLLKAILVNNPVSIGADLVISNRIVGDRHGCEIEFESHPGETRFKVRAPR